MNKYIKYKYKYLYLKNKIGGFRLNSEKDGNYLYPKVKSYYEKYQDDFNIILDYINFLQCKVLIDFNSDIELRKQIINQYDRTLVNDSELNNIDYIYNKIYNILENHPLLYGYLYGYLFGRSLGINLPIKSSNETLDDKLNDIIKLFNTLYEHISKLINKILDKDNKDRNELLLFLFTKFLNNYEPLNNPLNIQYAALVFISFISEFELFLLTYSKIPYNYFISNPYNYGYEKNEEGNIRSDNIIFNNIYEQTWEDHLDVNKPTTRYVYNGKFPSNVLEILKYYIDTLESLYKDCVESFITSLKRIVNILNNPPTIDEFNKMVYNTYNPNSYDHINRDFHKKLSGLITNFDSMLHNHITKFISNNHVRDKLNYNTSQYSLFCFVFCLNNSHSCTSLSLLKIYILFRLKIPNIKLLLQSKCTTSMLCDIRKNILQIMLNIPIDHWETDVNDSCFKLPDKTTNMEIDIKDGHIEIFISYIIFIYSNYINIYNFAKISDNIITDIINNILILIIKILLDKNKILLLEIIIKYKHILYFINKDELIQLLESQPLDPSTKELINLVKEYKETKSTDAIIYKNDISYTLFN